MGAVNDGRTGLVVTTIAALALVPLALRGERYRPLSADRPLRRDLAVHGLGGLITPFIGIEAIDLLPSLLPGL